MYQCTDFEFGAVGAQNFAPIINLVIKQQDHI